MPGALRYEPTTQGYLEIRHPIRHTINPFRGETVSNASGLARPVTFAGAYTGPGRATVRVLINTAGAPDTFDWTITDENAEVLATATAVAVTGAAQALVLGITVTFTTTTGHTATDTWETVVSSDATQLRSSAAVGFGLETRGHHLSEADGELRHLVEVHANSATAVPRLQLRRSRGTRTAQTILQNGDDIGAIDFLGYDGSAADATADSAWVPAARILCEVGAAPGASDMPGQLLFQVTADGAATPTTALSIAPSGAITIGGTLSVGALEVGGGYAGGSGSTLSTTGDGQFNGNLTVDGNLTVSGTLTQLDVDNIITEDPLISLGRSNAADLLDLGVYAQYNDGTERFTGLFRDATDGVWKLFDTLTVEPTTTVNTAGAGYDHGDLRVGGLTVDDNAVVTGNLQVDGNTTVGSNNADTVALNARINTSAQFSAGANRTLDVAAEAADTAGRALAVTAGAGGVSAAAAGGLGGSLTTTAGAGGVGGAAQLAGAGGAHVVRGGDAGADGGGGGAAGGDLSLRGGNASGAGTDGVVRVGDANTSAVIVTPATTFSAVADFDAGQTLAAGQAITGDGALRIGVVAGAFNLTFRMGDAAGAQRVVFEDSGTTQVAFVNSDGLYATSVGASGGGFDTRSAGELRVGPTNATSVTVTPAATFSAVADFNAGATLAAGQSIRGDGALTVDIAAAAADTAGAALAVTGGAGGIAVAAAGGLGGANTVSGGAGGAGAAAQLAGAGGAAIVRGGNAGADGGGGGAAGGDLSLRGGNASGAGVDGVVRIGDVNTSSVVVTPASTHTGLADFDAGLTLAAGQNITGDGSFGIRTVAGAFNVTLRSGDAAGAQGVSFTDSADAQVAFLTSNGTLRLAAGEALDTLAAGALNVGPTNATSVLVTPATTFTATADFNGGQTIAAGQAITGDGALRIGVAAGAFNLSVRMGDAAGAQTVLFEDSAGATQASINSDGLVRTAAAAGGLDTLAAGALRIGPATATSVVITPASTHTGVADFDAGATVAAGQSILGDGALTVGVVDGAFNLTLQMGDAAGVQGVSFEDSADAQVAFLTSDGDLRVLAGSGLDTLAAGQLDLGSTNATSIVATPAVVCTTSVAAGAGANINTMPGSGTTGVTYGGALRPRRSIVLGAREAEDGSAATATAVAVANSKAYWAIGNAAGAVDESVRFAFVVPDWAADGASAAEDILVALYVTDATGAGGNIVWRIDWAVRDNADLLTAVLAPGTQTAAVAMVATADALRVFGHTSSQNAQVTDANLIIPGSTIAKGELVEFEVRRVASDIGDTVGNDIRLWKVHCELVADRA